MAKKQKASELRNRQKDARMASSRDGKLQGRPQGNRNQGRLGVRRKRNTAWWWIGGIVLVCALAIGAFFITSNNQQQAQNQKASSNINGGNATVLKQVTSVSSSVRQTVNTGGLSSVVTPVSGKAALTGSDGKPEFFYYGAEWCPYCAANRWSMVIALSQFGTFKNLPQTLSSSTDTDPNTPTFTFVNTGYTSSYIDFVPLETQDRDRNTIQNPTADQQALLTSFNVQGYPFLDIGNKYQAGALYDPATLANLSQAQVASKLTNPDDTVTKNIVGGANYLTAAICSVIQDKLTSVCSQDPIPALETALSQGQTNTLPGGLQGALAYINEERRSF